jgi:hypothetical protein
MKIPAMMCEMYVSLESKKVKLIPLIPMSSTLAHQWKTLQLYENLTSE